MRYVCHALIAWMLLISAFLPWQSYAEQTTTQTFLQAEINQLVAPIALYPDPLLAQILMASTYPIEIIAAANWLKENPGLKGEALRSALEQQTWDDSVKSLTAIPEILNRLSEKLEMTIKLGDAFLAQKDDVFIAIQNLRKKAKETGNLNSSKEQVVTTVENTNSQALQQESSYIIIEPAEPDVFYVPSYDPNIVYGEWPYSDYPVDYYYPAGYAYLPGMALAYSLGYLLRDDTYGDINWTGQGITINIDRHNEFTGENIKNRNWEHDSTHRKGLPYRDSVSQNKYPQAQMQSVQVREALRGYQSLNSNDVDSVQQKISDDRTNRDQRFNASQASEVHEHISTQDLKNLSQQGNDNKPRRDQLDGQGLSQIERSDLQEQKRQFRDQEQKRERNYQYQQEQERIHQRDQQHQRIELQEQREHQQQRIERQQQIQQRDMQRQQANIARQRPADPQRGNAFQGVNNAAQTRQYSQRGATSRASGRGASRPAGGRGGHGGGRGR